MPFELYYLPAYERCLKRLGDRQRRIAEFIVLGLWEHFNSGILTLAGPHMVPIDKRTYRLVFKKLQGPIWEAYIEGQIRILTRLEQNKHFLVFVGNHDQVRQFLKNI